MEAFNLIQFYNSFATEEQCQKFLFERRWSDGVVCPKCGEIGVTQKTAWFMLQRIRHVFESGSFEKLFGEVEMDEAYIGGADKNKHHSKKLKNPHRQNQRGSS